MLAGGQGHSFSSIAFHLVFIDPEGSVISLGLINVVGVAKKESLL